MAETTPKQTSPARSKPSEVDSSEQPRPKKQPRKRKVRLSGDQGRAYVQATFNNTVISFTDRTGNVIAWGSAGVAGFKGSRKSTPYAATTATQKAAETAKQAGLKTVEVLVRGVGSGRDAAVRALQSSGLTITVLKDVTPIPHNGVRAKKPRRV